jgi:hypothetical protein
LITGGHFPAPFNVFESISFEVAVVTGATGGLIGCRGFNLVAAGFGSRDDLDEALLLVDALLKSPDPCVILCGVHFGGDANRQTDFSRIPTPFGLYPRATCRVNTMAKKRVMFSLDDVVVTPRFVEKYEIFPKLNSKDTGSSIHQPTPLHTK